jgi:hypothetical protein
MLQFCASSADSLQCACNPLGQSPLLRLSSSMPVGMTRMFQDSSSSSSGLDHQWGIITGDKKLFGYGYYALALISSRALVLVPATGIATTGIYLALVVVDAFIPEFEFPVCAEKKIRNTNSLLCFSNVSHHPSAESVPIGLDHRSKLQAVPEKGPGWKLVTLLQ